MALNIFRHQDTNGNRDNGNRDTNVNTQINI